MQEERSNEDYHLSQKQVILIFHIGFIILLPLIGTTVFNEAKDIIEYYNNGFYHTDCNAYYFPNFTKYDSTPCESREIVQLVLGFSINTAIFNFGAYRVYKYITNGVNKK